MIVKMIFLNKIYYIHIALIQYIIMDKLLNIDKNHGLTINELYSQTNISIKNLQETINTLLQVKLIKYSTDTTIISNIKFYINYEFNHENNKISLSSLIIPK
jgi:predicted transcriptional regulator